MLNAIMIEDEKPALETLMRTLNEVSADVNIIATLKSVKESIDYLSAPNNADIIFSDVQLPDGLSFEIFNHADVKAPVIFITGYDQFMLNAFEYNGIDYLLKPVNKYDLEKALQKYKRLEKHFETNNTAIEKLLDQLKNKKKSRILVRKGIENIPLRLEDIVLFYTENKVVYVIDKDGKKYFADKNLTDLEHELDEAMFFRANRQYIININYVKGFKAYEKVKLQVDLTMDIPNHYIIISQETAPEFRDWMYNA